MQSANSHKGWPGRHCTEYREAHTCPDNVQLSSTTSFTCSDPNLYWLNDFSCACSFMYANISVWSCTMLTLRALCSNGEYDASTLQTCGNYTVLTSAHAGINLSNWELTRLLEADDVIRAHVCRQIGGAADCSRATL